MKELLLTGLTPRADPSLYCDYLKAIVADFRASRSTDYNWFSTGIDFLKKPLKLSSRALALSMRRELLATFLLRFFFAEPDFLSLNLVMTSLLICSRALILDYGRTLPSPQYIFISLLRSREYMSIDSRGSWGTCATPATPP